MAELSKAFYINHYTMPGRWIIVSCGGSASPGVLESPDLPYGFNRRAAPNFFLQNGRRNYWTNGCLNALRDFWFKIREVDWGSRTWLDLERVDKWGEDLYLCQIHSHEGICLEFFTDGRWDCGEAGLALMMRPCKLVLDSLVLWFNGCSKLQILFRVLKK